MPTPPTGRPNAWPCPTIPPLFFLFLLDSCNTTTLHFYSSDTIWNFLGCWQTSQASNLITIKNCLQIPLPAAEATAKADRRILHQVSQHSSTSPALLRSSAIPDSQLCTILMISAAFSLFERNTLHAKLDSQRPEIGWMTNIAPAHLCQHLCMFWKTFGTKSTSGLQHVVLTGPSVISVTAAEHGVNLVVTSCTRGL